MKDTYGLQTSIDDQQALSTWQAGLQKAFSFDASGIAELKAAISFAPDFVLAHAALARQHMIHGDQISAAQSLRRAHELSVSGNQREASLVNVLSLSMSNQPTALRQALEHLDAWPLDIFVLSLVVGPFGLLAFSGRQSWPEDCLQLLLKYRNYWPEGDWWYLSALGFSFAECRRLIEAEKVAERAWVLRPNGNCAHTLSHVHFETGDATVGRSFLSDWLEQYGADSDMRHHLVWHDSLYQFESDLVDRETMSELFYAELDHQVSDPMPLTTFSDNASFLWRCCLRQAPLEARIARETLEYAERYFPEPGFFFVDVHRVLVSVLTGSDEVVRRLEEQLKQLQSELNMKFLNQLLRAARAFCESNFPSAAKLLEPLLKTEVVIGGSHPQRAIITQTYTRSVQLAEANHA